MKKREGISGAREDPQGLGEEQDAGGGRDGGLGVERCKDGE